MKFKFTQVIVISTLFSVFVNAETEEKHDAKRSTDRKNALYFRHASTEKDYADQVM